MQLLGLILVVVVRVRYLNILLVGGAKRVADDRIVGRRRCIVGLIDDLENRHPPHPGRVARAVDV